VVVTFGIFALSWPLVRHRARELLYAAAPIALMLVLSTAYLGFNSGRLGFISHNGSFNLVFGRCHNYKASWTTPGGNGAFLPAGLLQVHRRGEAAAKRGEEYWLQLDPAITPDLKLTSRPGEPGPLLGLVWDCVKRTGPLRQARYSATNVLMLWNGNLQFPAWAAEPASRDAERWFRTLDQVLFQVPFLLGLAFVVGRDPGRRVVAGNGVALVLTSALYFGEIRMRLPYMGLVMLLSFELLADAARAARARMPRGR
jgi:hypothetical protein